MFFQGILSIMERVMKYQNDIDWVYRITGKEIR